MLSYGAILIAGLGMERSQKDKMRAKASKTNGLSLRKGGTPV